MQAKLDTLIVGAGVVGCAVAYALRNHPGTVYWVEAAAQAGSGMTSRNSGVIHAGIYYPQESLKTQLCRRGNALLYAFAEKYQVPHLRTGKYLVANNEAEIRFLASLEAHNTQVPLQPVKKLPPGIRAQRACFSPTTGVIDQHTLVQALIEASGMQPLYHQRVTRMECRDDCVQVVVGGETYVVNRVFNCTGLQAAGFSENHRHYLARGSYFQVALPTDISTPHLVYPAVPKSSDSLGIHLTRNLHGEAFLGPDLVWIEAERYLVEEAARDRFFQAASRYLPWLKPGMLQPAYAGIRAKLSREQFCDFQLEQVGEVGQLCHFLGIESPGLTAALALAEVAIQRMGFEG